MDVDLSTNLESFLPLVAPIVSGHSELAIGSRLARQAHVRRQIKREVALARLQRAHPGRLPRRVLGRAVRVQGASARDIARRLLPARRGRRLVLRHRAAAARRAQRPAHPRGAGRLGRGSRLARRPRAHHRRRPARPLARAPRVPARRGPSARLERSPSRSARRDERSGRFRSSGREPPRRCLAAPRPQPRRGRRARLSAFLNCWRLEPERRRQHLLLGRRPQHARRASANFFFVSFDPGGCRRSTSRRSRSGSRPRARRSSASRAARCCCPRRSPASSACGSSTCSSHASSAALAGVVAALALAVSPVVGRRQPRQQPRRALRAPARGRRLRAACARCERGRLRWLLRLRVAGRPRLQHEDARRAGRRAGARRSPISCSRRARCGRGSGTWRAAPAPLLVASRARGSPPSP